MPARAEQVALPAPLRWLGAAAMSALIAAALLKLRKQASKPTVPAMSDDWLRHHNASRRADP